MIWRCPRCRGELNELAEALTCGPCAAHYECVDGIPDLRLPGPSWIEPEEDRAAARRMAEELRDANVEDLIGHIFAQEGWDREWIELRTRQIVTAPERLQGDLRGWLRPCLSESSPFLDLGCGPGMLLASASSAGYEGVGIDVCMTWLVVARKLIAGRGGTPRLAAARAESLPLADGAVSGVVSLDVIEHVADPGPYLREIDRVTRPGGGLALSTPNRYSLTAEPHIFVWGVGWVPRRWQRGFVKWRSGRDYDYVRLLSTREATRLVRQHTGFRSRVLIPPVAEEEIARYPAPRAGVARAYNRLARSPLLRWLFLMVGPFFRVVGVKGPRDAGPKAPREEESMAARG